jgi:monoamine oxidase
MVKRNFDFDTLIIGAGAAGLAAAAELSAAGQCICILEARDRIGGRIFTRFEPDLAAPIELEAEFIHGLSPVTRQWLPRGGRAAIDAPQARWMLERNRLLPAHDAFSLSQNRCCELG